MLFLHQAAHSPGLVVLPLQSAMLCAQWLCLGESNPGLQSNTRMRLAAPDFCGCPACSGSPRNCAAQSGSCWRACLRSFSSHFADFHQQLTHRAAVARWWQQILNVCTAYIIYRYMLYTQYFYKNIGGYVYIHININIYIYISPFWHSVFFWNEKNVPLTS